jgi:zinc protease
MSSLQRIQPPVYPVEKVVIPDPLSLFLDNGLQVFMTEAGTEDIMRIEFSFRAGQVMETKPLVAATANMMLSEGSLTYSSEELNRILDFYGIFLHQYADKDRAGIVLYFLSKHTSKATELSYEIVFRPLFRDDELNNLMKKRLSWFLVNREKVNNLASDQFFESVFGNTHPYGRQTIETDFENILSSDLREFHSKYYTPENMTLFVSGKIHPDTFDLLNTLYGKTPIKKTTFQIAHLNPTVNGKREIHIDKPGSVQSAIRIGSATINKTHPDYPGLKVLDSILGGYFGSRLMKNIREEKGYTYGINSGVSSLELSGYKLISTEVGKKHLQKSIDEIYREIILLQTTPVSAEELELVRNNMSGELLRTFDGPFALAESFRAAWEFGLDNKYYYRLAEKIRTITPDEIIVLARTYYNINDLYEITVGSK